MVQALLLGAYLVVPLRDRLYYPLLEDIIQDMEEKREEPHPHLQLVDQ